MEARLSKLQKDWFTAIERDASKDVISIDYSSLGSSHQTEEIKVSVLDYDLSSLLERPTIVQVTLDLLANEKEVYVRTTSLGNKPAEAICTFHTQFGGEKVNVWNNGSVAVSYELGKPTWVSESAIKDTNTEEFILKNAIAKDLFKSATNNGYAGYRGYRPNKANISAVRAV